MFAQVITNRSPFQFRIGFPGCPSYPHVPWDAEMLGRLARMGFNVVQLNIAWGARPGDEPLNLEDVVDVRGTDAEGFQTLPLKCKDGPEAFERRRADLRARIAQCRALGLRTLFHFGAPYNRHNDYGDNPPNCMEDERVTAFYETMLERFASQFPGVDDILLYTYDQDAWLCSEFGECPRCMGLPLHERAVRFVNRLARVWRRLSPHGRLWWEPWEFSAGQALRAIEGLDVESVGLMLHCNVAEVMATLPVDRWLKNMANLAAERKMPVVVEYFLGGATEESEPLLHLCWPPALWRGLQTIAALSVAGIKEYYGCLPDREDPNLRMAGIFFSHPDLAEDDALRKLAEPYGACAQTAVSFWRACGSAMELFPWETSWHIRKIGRSDPSHAMTTAFLRGQMCHTPSWESSRRAIFMKNDNLATDPWMLEDVQLRCELAEQRMSEALDLARTMVDKLSGPLATAVEAQIADIDAWRRRTLAYIYHIRASNLTAILRKEIEKGHTVPQRIIEELKTVLTADRDNQGQPEPCQSALQRLESNPAAFALEYYADPRGKRSGKGCNSVTSQ